MRWFIVHVLSGYEKTVVATLKERINIFEMEHLFGEIIVPTEEVVEMRGGKKRKSERKFFPGYVMVQMEMDNETWHLVQKTPKVMGFIGGKGDNPSPITEAEVETVFNRVRHTADKPVPKIVFGVGEMVRITDGPFNDFNGVVEEVNYDKNRLQVSVVILGRATPVDLEFDQVEKS